MKKIFACVLALFIVASLSMTAFAADFSTGADAELESIADEIVVVVNDLYGEIITDKDIDFSDALKVYVDTNVFELSTNSASEIKNTLEAGNYIYLLPIKTGKGIVVVNIQKGLPLSEHAKEVLTEKEQQEVLENVGKWVISSATLYNSQDTAYNYSATLSKKVGEIPDGTLLVGSLPIFEDVVALIPDSNGLVEKIVPLTNTSYDLGAISNSRNSSEIYDYSTIKAYANSLPEGNPNLAGGGADVQVPEPQAGMIFVVAAVIIVCGGAAMILYKNKKNKSGGSV